MGALIAMRLEPKAFIACGLVAQKTSDELL